MAIKRIRSEYMKKFKDPKREMYTKCYEELLKYRLTRRLLEHTHNPWFWNGSDSDSDTGGRSPPPPPPPAKNQVQAQLSGARAGAELEECEQTRRNQQQEHEAPTTEPVSRLPLQNEEQNTSALCGPKSGGVVETRVLQEEREGQRKGSRDKKELTASHIVQVKENRRAPSKPPKSVKQTTRSQRIRPEPLSQTKEDIKDRRHPFALYASGERDADIAARKTHNVGAAAPNNEIHESALRAQTRRRVERHFQTQRSERRRTRSADLDKVKNVVQPEFNPWLTEYMRCYSTRSR